MIRVCIATAAAALISVPAVAQADPVSPLHRLVDTAAQRLETADAVAASKWINGGPITDPTRANKVLDDVSADATAHGVDSHYVRTAFVNQIDATEGIQYTRFGQWKFNPATAPTTAPDLSESRTAIDGYNKVMVEEIARNWPVLRGPGCVGDLSTAMVDVTAERQLDPLYRDALTSATRSYCAT